MGIYVPIAKGLRFFSYKSLRNSNFIYNLCVVTWRNYYANMIQSKKRAPCRCLNAEKLLVQQDPSVYYFISQGCLTVDNINDQEEMDMVEVCTA